MPNRHFNELVAQAKALGAETISVFGYGEPLCDQNVVEKVQAVSDAGLESFITTNASLLDSDLSSRLVGAGLSHVRFSAHGLWDNYESVHRGLKFDRFMRNVFNFIAISRGGVKISVSVIPMFGESVGEIREFWEFGS
jgi:MoaA/NifB/PqqE/SkfB family radical SAM enzyme